MEYQRQLDSIQADFALRAGGLLVDYDQVKVDGKKFEGTLTVCVLQSLLTQCSELIQYLQAHGPTVEFFSRPITDCASDWGLSTGLVREYTFPSPLTLARLLEHMRNAVSHPSFDGSGADHVPTGFTTTDAGAGAPIAAYVFTDSPWVKSGRRWFRKSLPFPKENEVSGLAKQWHRTYGVNDFLATRASPEGGFDLYRGDQIYWPVFQIELSIAALRHLTLELANYLGQKTLPGWDGRTVDRLLLGMAA